MSLQFTTSNQHSDNHGIKGLVYGEAGTGKTTLAATAPSPLILAVEAGMLSLRRSNLERLFGVGTPGITYDVPAIIIRSLEDLNEAYTFCTTNPSMGAIQTLYLDSLTEIAEVVLNAAKRTVRDPRQAYGELIEKMETLIRAFVNLPGKHVIMTSKMEPMKDELTGVVRYGPMMPGAKLSVKLPYMYDEVFRLGVNKDPQGNAFRFLQTQPDMQFQAKDRSGALAPMEPPHLAHIFAKIGA
jgi:hypothetical protein